MPWLDLSNNANKLRQTYVKGFVDISGSGLSLRSDASINLYSSKNDTTPHFSINSGRMKIYDGMSSYYDMSNSQLLYLKDIKSDINAQLTDLINRTSHITTNTVTVDTMLEFDDISKNIVTYSNIVPATASTYSLGSIDKPFQSLYVNQGTIHFINPQTTQEEASVSYDPLTQDLYLKINNVLTPLNNTRYVNDTLITPLLTYGDKVGIGTTDPKANLDISGNVTIQGKALIQGLLEIIMGDLSLSGNIIANRVFENGTPISDKYLSIDSPIINGITTATVLNVNEDLKVAGNTYLDQNLDVSLNAVIRGNTTIGGYGFVTTPSVGDNSNKIATTAFVLSQGLVYANNSNLTGTTNIFKANVQQRMTVAGDVSLNSKLQVFDNTILYNNLYVNGTSVLTDASVNGNINVRGNMTAVTQITSDNSNKVATTAFVQNQGFVTASGGIFTSTPIFNNNLIVLGDASVNSRLFIGNNAIFNSNVNVNGNLIVTTLPNDNSSNNVATTAYVKNQGYATIASPTFTGVVNIPNANVTQIITGNDLSFNGNATVVTQPVTDNSNKIATTAFVQSQGYATISSPTFTGNAGFSTLMVAQKILANDISMNGNLSVGGYAKFAGNTTAITQPLTDSSTKVATTAYVQNQRYATIDSPTFTGTVNAGKTQINGDISLNANVYLIGNTYAVTQLNNDSSTKVATTAYVQNQKYATIDSPQLTGVPTAPTPQLGDTSTQIATTEYVRNEVVNFINSVPSAFDAIQQLSQAFSNTDASFSLFISEQLATKANVDSPVFTTSVSLPQTTINDLLISTSDVSINGNVLIGGNTAISGVLNIVTPDTSDNSTQAATTAYVQNQNYAKLSGATFTGDVSTSGNMVVSQNLTVNNTSEFNNDVNIFANVNIQNDINVQGNIVSTNGLIISNDASFNSNVYIKGYTYGKTPFTNDNSNKLATTEYVQSQGFAKLLNSSFQGDTTMNARLNVVGDAILQSNLVVYGEVSMNQDISIGGNANINHILSVSNDVFVNNRVFAKQFVENNLPLSQIYAPQHSPLFTGDVSGITKSMVGLDQVDNTSDANKPLSDLQILALSLKANVDSPTFTTIVTLPFTNVQDKLNVTGDVSFNSRMIVNGDVSMSGIVNVTTPSTADNSTKVATTAFVKNQGYALLSGSAFSGNVLMNQNLAVSGNTTLQNMTITNNSLFQGKPVFMTDVSLNSRMIVAKDAILNSNLTVGGDILLNGNLFMNGQFSVNTPSLNDNSTKIATTAFVKGQQYAQLSGATFTGDVSFNRGINVQGNTTLNSLLINNNINVSNDAIVGGNTFINGGLVISKDVSMNKNLFIGGNVITNGYMQCSTPTIDNCSNMVATTEFVKAQAYAPIDSPNFIGTINMPSAVISQNLIANSDAYLNANVIIGGNLTISSTPPTDNCSNMVATTAFVKAQPFAPLFSPRFTGVVTMQNLIISQKTIVLGDASINGVLNVNSPSLTDNSTTVATTAFVKAQPFAPLSSPSFTGDVSMNGNLFVANQIYENGTALINKYAPTNSPTFTGTVSGITKSMVGLDQVNNTSDVNKPVSTAQQSALNLKANIASPSFTGNVTAVNMNVTGLLTAGTPNTTENSTVVATTEYVQNQPYVKLTGAAFTGNVSTTQNLSANGDLTISGNATINKHVFIGSDVSINGIIQSITTSYNDNSTKVATTEFVNNQGFAKLSSPTFTGTPTAPTISVTLPTSNQIATTSYVEQKISDFFNTTATSNTINAINALSNALSNENASFAATIATQLSYKANIASPEFTGDVKVGGNISSGGDISLNGNIHVGGLIFEQGELLSQRYAPTHSPVFTGTVYGITKSMVGLDQIDNTSDMNKPVSTQQQTALDLKANIANPIFNGIVDVRGPLLTRGDLSLNGNMFCQGIVYENSVPISSTYAPQHSPIFTGDVSGITKVMVGLDQVDNTSDINKPVSTQQQSALDLKANIANPRFTGDVSMQGNLFVGNKAYAATPLTNDISTRIATTEFVQNFTNIKNQSYALLTGANFTGDVSINTNTYIGGDLSLAGRIFAQYPPNSIPFNAIMNSGNNMLDLSSNQFIGGIKTFTNDVSMAQQLNVTGNTFIASNNIVTTLPQPAVQPTALTMSNFVKLTNNYGGTFITEFEIDKGSGNTLSYNLTDGSYNVSNDGGQTWTVMSNSTSGNKFAGMLCLSPDGRIRLKQEHSTTSPTSPASLLYVSTNWGQTWTQLSLNKSILYTNTYFNYTTYNSQTYAFSHDGSVLYFIARDINSTITIWKSTDNTFTNFTNQGLTWNYTLNNCPRAIATSCDGKYVLTITGIMPNNGMYLAISTDYGNTYTRTASETNTTWNSIAVSYSGQYQVATTDVKIYQSNDYGQTWITTGAVPDSQWVSINMSNDGKNRLACVANGYQYLSVDYGQTWNQVPNSQGNWKKVIMTDLCNNDNIIAYAHDGLNIYKNYYKCEAKLNNTAINTDMQITPVSHHLNALGKSVKTVKTNVFNNYVGTTPGMSTDGKIILIPIQGQQSIISYNYGESWNRLNGLISQTGYHSAAISGNGQVIYIRKATTTYRSSNYGNTWTPYTTLSVDDRLAGTALSNTGQYIVLAGQDLSSGNSNIYVSNNYGVSWNTVATFPINGNMFCACMTDSGQYMSVLSTSSYVLVSNDYGQTWAIKYINALLQSNYMCMSSTGQYQTVVNTNSIFVSNDYGNTFSETFASNTVNLTRVTMIGTGEYQYAVDSSNSVMYCSTDYGQTWATLFTNKLSPYNSVVSKDGTFMLYGISGDIVVSRKADNIGTISSTGVSISRKGVVSSLDVTVNGTVTTQSLVVNQIYENGNLLGSKYAPLNSPTFTGNVSGITKSMVGLNNIDNTSDVNKPVSTAQQNALNLKANIASPQFTGAVSLGQSAFVNGDMSMNGNLIIVGDISINGNLVAHYADNTIPVTALIGGIPQATGIFEMDIKGESRLFVAGDSSLNGGLFVNGTTTLSTANINTSLYVNGTTIFNGQTVGNDIITNTLTINNNALLYGDVSLNGRLFANNTIYEKGVALENKYATIDYAVFTDTTTVEKLVVTQDFLNERDSTMNGNLSVLKDTTVNGNMYVNTQIFENGISLIDKYATLNSPTFTGTVSGITKSMVGLSNVNNTADLEKPISLLTQYALDLKSNSLSPTFTGVPLAPTAAAGTNTKQIATTEFVGTAIVNLMGPSTGGSLDTLHGIAQAINYDASFCKTVDTSLNLKANIASPTFTGIVTLPTTDISNSLHVNGSSIMNGDVSMNTNLYVGGDLSVNGNISGKYPLHSIPSDAITFLKNDYSSMMINTQRTDQVEYDDEFFETCVPSGFNGYTEVFYSNYSDLSLSGNININGSGESVIQGNVRIQSDMAVYGVINQQYMEFNDEGLLYLEDRELAAIKELFKVGGTGLGTGSVNNITLGSTDASGSTSNVNIVGGLIAGGDVSLNSNVDVSGSILTHNDMIIGGVINQQGTLIEENGHIYSVDYGLEGIKNQFVVESNKVTIAPNGATVIIGDYGQNVNIHGDLYAPGLSIGKLANGQNTILGYYAGSSIATGINNSLIGYNAQPSTSSSSNEITLGNASITKLRCAATTITALSDRRDKKSIEEIPVGLEFIDSLKPVKFEWNTRDGSRTGEKDYGFIAQDLLEAQNEANITVPNLVYSENPDKLEASYGALIPVMVKAIQDLKSLVTEQQKEIIELKERLLL